MSRLKELRLSRNMSQSCLTERADVFIDTVRKLEYGVNNLRNAKGITLLGLSRALGVTIEELIR